MGWFDFLSGWSKVLKEHTHGDLGFIEFRIKMKPSIDKIEDLEDNLRDLMSKFQRVLLFKGTNSNEWKFIDVLLKRLQKTYKLLLNHIQKWPITVRYNNVERYKRRLQTLLDKTTVNFNKEFDTFLIYIIKIRTPWIKDYGPYCEEVMYLQLALKYSREIKSILSKELTIGIDEYIEQPNDYYTKKNK